MIDDDLKLLQSAWSRRVHQGYLPQAQALRLYHGPGDTPFGSPSELRELAIDRFGEHAWVTLWRAVSPETLATVAEFLKRVECKSAVVLNRPERGVPADPVPLFGEVPSARFAVEENDAKFWIQLQGVKHPGLFLDHAPLRLWLAEHMRDLKVLNTFAYTGSLSVAAGRAGAAHVTTLDLSKPVTKWGEDNWALNGLVGHRARYIFGDVFEWLPRLQRAGEQYDCVILDPPSFSRGKKGTFSTAKDLVRLHELAMALLGERGYLVTSINSASIPRKKFEADVQAAASRLNLRFDTVRTIEQPETFPATRPEDRYLKGLILRRARG